MRILLVNSFYYPRGGDCIHMLALEQRLLDRGHEVAVFSMHHPENLQSPWSSYWVPNVEFKGTLPWSRQLAMLLRTAYSATAAKAFERLVSDFRPEVVHFHSVHHHLTTAPVSRAKKMGLPVVWTLHDYRLVCPATHLLRHGKPCTDCAGGRFVRAVGRRCKSDSVTRTLAAAFECQLSRAFRVSKSVDCFIAPSQFLADICHTMGLPAARIEVLPNPVDARDPPTSLHRNHDVLYVGRLSREKGVETLLRAIVGIQGVSVAVAGDGPERERLEAFAARERPGVEFCGWLSHEQVLAAMADSRVLAVPSVWYENCPSVVLEAMQSGTLLVVSDIGGLRELTDNGRCGYLAQPGDVADWLRVLTAALTDEVTATRMTTVAVARTRERHSWQRYLGRLEHLYEEVSAANTC